MNGDQCFVFCNNSLSYVTLLETYSYHHEMPGADDVESMINWFVMQQSSMGPLILITSSGHATKALNLLNVKALESYFLCVKTGRS